MPYNQFGEYVDDNGFNPNPGSGMPSVSSDGGVLGPNGWSNQSFSRTVNDPRSAYVPLYDHTHMDEDAGFASQLQGARINPNSPQGANAMRFLQLQQLQNRQPNQNFQPPPGVYDFDPTKLFGASRNQAYGAVRGVSRGVGGAIDNVYTGHGSERLPEDPRILGIVPQLQRQLSGGAPGYSQIGNTVQLQGNYAPRQIPEGADDSYAQRLAQAAAGPALTSDQRDAQLRQILQQKQARGEIDGEQASQIYTHVMGVDPISYAANQQKTAEQTRNDNFKAAKEMQDKRDALLKERAELARQGGGIPEDIRASFGKNPAGAGHENEYFNPGVDMGPDPNDPSGPHKIEKSGWRGINPGTVARLAEIDQQLGLRVTDQDVARHAELAAKAAQPGPVAPSQPPSPASTSLTSWLSSPSNDVNLAGYLAAPALVGNANAGMNALQYLRAHGALQALRNNASGAFGGLQSAVNTANGQIGGMLGSASRFFGAGQQPQGAPPSPDNSDQELQQFLSSIGIAAQNAGAGFGRFFGAQ